MTHQELDTAYKRFASIYGNGRMIRTAAELEAAVSAAGMELGEVGEGWLRTLSRDWVYGDSEDPFPDEGTNRQYRRLLSSQ